MYKKLYGRTSPPPNVDEIANAAYFTRVWVAQEIVLGKSVVCQLGHLLFSRATLIASMELWQFVFDCFDSGLRDDTDYYYIKPSLDETWHSFRNIHSVKQDMSIVKAFRDKECSDPRDRIYSLSALFTNPTAYTIDYSLSVAEVFCNFTVHCLETSNGLSEVLGLLRPTHMAPPAHDSLEIHDVENDFALPSWCSSWAEPDYRKARTLHWKPKGHWNAHGGQRIQLERPHPLMITLEGCVVSKVVWCGTKTMALNTFAGTLIKEAVQFLLSGPRFPSPPSNMQNLRPTRTAFSVLKTLAFDTDFQLMRWKYFDQLSQPTRTLLDVQPKNSVLDFLGPVYLASVFPDLCSSADLKIDTRIPTEDYETIIALIERSVLDDSYGCRLFATDGGILGTGVPEMMAGDLVCILFGGIVPYILRPTEVEGQYLLIGECYVEALMEGQAMEMRLQEQKFTLV
jgi:hypothetical protein